MANPLLKDTSHEAPTVVLERLPALAILGRVNRALFLSERALVCAAMLVMSFVVFLDVMERYLRSQRGTWIRIERGDAAWLDLWPVLAVLAIAWAVFGSIWRTNPQMGGLVGLQRIFTAISVVVFAVFCAGMLWLPSQLMLSLLVLISALVLVRLELDRPVPEGTEFVHRRRIGNLALIAMAFVVGLVLATSVPEGYSWAQSFALFLLLWTAFIGASMATYERRHLAIDAVRKIIPARHAPFYNAASHLLAAVVTGAFVYLAILYFQMRLGQTSAPGQIPSWIKVLAIPVSLALVTLRFFGHAVMSFLEGLFREEPPEADPNASTDSHILLPAGGEA